MSDTKGFSGVSFGGSQGNGKKSRKGTIIGFIILGLIAVVFAGILVFQAAIFIAGIHDNWSELKFAFEKPAIVRSVRLDYQAKEQAVEASYKAQKQTAQDQLIQEVTTQIKNGSK